MLKGWWVGREKWGESERKARGRGVSPTLVLSAHRFISRAYRDRFTSYKRGKSSYMFFQSNKIRIYTNSWPQRDCCIIEKIRQSSNSGCGSKLCFINRSVSTYSCGFEWTLYLFAIKRIQARCDPRPGNHAAPI